MYDVWAVWRLYDVWDVWGCMGMYGMYGLYGHTLAWDQAWTLYGRPYSAKAVCAAVWAPVQTRSAYTPTRAYMVTTLPQTRTVAGR